MQSDELLIGTAEAAAVLGVDPTTVQRWAAKGQLTFVRKLPKRNGAFLFDAGVIRRKAQERLLRQYEARQAS